MSVGRQRQVQRLAPQRPHPGQFLHQIHQPAPQQRLAARQPHLGDPQPHKQPDQTQILVDPQLGILRPHLARPAIDALVVAAVSDGDAQVVDHPPVAVGQPGCGSRGVKSGREATAICNYKAIPFQRVCLGRRI